MLLLATTRHDGTHDVGSLSVPATERFQSERHQVALSLFRLWTMLPVLLLSRVIGHSQRRSSSTRTVRGGQRMRDDHIDESALFVHRELSQDVAASAARVIGVARLVASRSTKVIQPFHKGALDHIVADHNLTGQHLAAREAVKRIGLKVGSTVVFKGIQSLPVTE